MRSVVVLAIVLSGVLLFLGGVTDAGVAMALVLSGAWAAYVIGLRQRGPEGRPIVLATAALWGAAAWSAFQSIPLPPRLLALLSPHAAEAWRRADLLLGVPVQPHPLSVDPPATMFAAATAIAVAITYVASVRYAGHRDARLRLLHAVIAATMLLNLLALAHRTAGLDRVYGFYLPRYPTSHGLLSPLLNPNHTAAIACVAPPLLIGISLGGSLTTRILASVGVVVSGAVAALSISRSGMLVFGLELGAMALYAASRRGKSNERVLRGASVLLALGGAVLAVLVSASDNVVAEAKKTDTSKLRVPLQALSLVRDYLFTGVGRGAFGSAFPAYEGSLPPNARYQFVESWPVQLAADMGVFAAVAFVAALGAAVFLTRRRVLARPPYVGALVALGGLVVHDLVDFSMEFAGTAMVAAVLLAVVTTTGSKSVPNPRTRWRLPTLVGLGLALGGFLLVRSWSHRADDEQLALQARLRAGEARPTVADAARAAIGRHPTDPFFPGLVGSLRIFDPGAGAYFVRSLELGPNRASTHLAFARWLTVSGRTPQAFAELRAALRLEPSAAAKVADEMVRMRAEVAELLALVDGPSTGDVVVGMLERARRVEDAETVDAYVIESYPPAISSRTRQIARLRLANKLPEARQLAADLRTVAPMSPEAWLASASLAETDVEAESLLAQGVSRVGRDLKLVEALTRRRAVRLGLAAVATDLAELQVAMEEAQQPAYQFHVFKAEVELARDRPSAAIRYYLDAAAAAPESMQFLEQAAQLAERTGQTSMAQSLWSRLAAMRPDDPRYRDKTLGKPATTIPSPLP